MRIVALLLMVGLLVAAGTVSAYAQDPWVQYAETDLGTGTWLYQFTIVNPLGSGVDVTDIVIATSSGVINNGGPFGMPPTWSLIWDPPEPDLIGWYAGGSGVGAGASLGGFSFQTSAPYAGSFAYELNGGDFAGDASVVPEPGTMAASLALLSPAMVSLVWRARRRRSRSA